MVQNGYWNGPASSAIHTARPQRLPARVGPLDHVLLVAASKLVTTTPPSRRRTAAPVSHQIMEVLTAGSPSGARRRARYSVVGDHIAVPSARRLGAPHTAARMRSRSVAP